MNIENAKQEFLNYVGKFDNTNPKLVRKIGHSLRVMEISTKIAESLKLSQEQIEIATLIGLLHDIGKIAQYSLTKDKKIEHGEFGTQILKKDNYIRKYISDDKYDNLIYLAIRNHGLLKIEEGLSEKELFFSKIIRDADKLDIFYEAVEMFWNDENVINEIEESVVSKDVIKDFIELKPIDRHSTKTKIDGVISVISFMFDINFKYPFEIIQKENYINKIIDKFNFKDEETKEQMMKIREIANQYIEKRNEQN